MPILVKMPKWGLMMKAGTVTEWLRAEGDAVAAGEPLFVVETDKAVNDVEAPGRRRAAPDRRRRGHRGRRQRPGRR